MVKLWSPKSTLRVQLPLFLIYSFFFENLDKNFFSSPIFEDKDLKSPNNKKIKIKKIII